MSTPASAEVHVGTILRETYEITGLLGEGGMGAVYSAKHLRLPKLVAVKVLHAGFRISEDVVARFRQEAEIASRLGHPNIVEVLDFDILPTGTPFLVLELLRGESLAQRLERGPLDWSDARPLVRQVGSALRAAHRAGVIHRDLKPDNIFLTPGESEDGAPFTVKVLDFGISKLTLSASAVKTQDSVLMGTPQYMSPEQALGKNSQVDARSDIFALGCIFFEMLVGRPPFTGEGIPQVIYSIVHAEPPSLAQARPDLPPEVARAVGRALAKNPQDRFPDVSAFIYEMTGANLKTVGEGPSSAPRGTLLISTEEIKAQAPTASDTSTDPPRRRAGKLIVAVLGLALVLGGAMIAVVRSTHRSPPTVSAPVARSEDVTPPKAVVTVPVQPKAPEVAAPAKEPPVAQATPSPSPSPGRGHAGRVGGGIPEIPVSEEARQDLQLSADALSHGDAEEALRFARRSQRSQFSGRSYALMTRAHCLQHDLSNARAQFAHVPAKLRWSVAQFCKQKEIEL